MLPVNLRPLLPLSEEEIMSTWVNNYEFPFVSILCLTYNHESYIKDALHGFLAQKTKYPFEVIIHDDCSSDDTQMIISSYAQKYPRIIVPVYQKRNLYSRGINIFSIVFPLARGKYIAYCEGDDYWVDQYKIEKQVSFLADNNEYCLCYTDAIPFNHKGVVKRNFGGATYDMPASHLLRSPGIYTLTTCFKNVVTIPPEFTMVKYSDKSLWSLLGNYGSGKYLDTVKPSMYRVHDSGVHSSASQEEHCEMDIQTASAMYSYYKRIKNVELQTYFYNKLVEYVLRKNCISVHLIGVMKVLSFILSKIKYYAYKLKFILKFSYK